jgi:hypothetical protein
VKKWKFERTVFAFGLDFDQHFGFPHYFDDFADITAGFVKQLELFPQKTDYKTRVRMRCFMYYH